MENKQVLFKQKKHGREGIVGKGTEWAVQGRGAGESWLEVELEGQAGCTGLPLPCQAARRLQRLSTEGL